MQKENLLNEALTTDICQKIQQLLEQESSYEAKKSITKHYLGMHILNDQQVLFGFWVPGLKDGFISSYKDTLRVQLWRHRGTYNFNDLQTLRFNLIEVPVETIDDYAICVLDGVNLGSKEQLGDLYWLIFNHQKEEVIRDPLAVSLPFGVYAPAEVYNMNKVFAKRNDLKYFKQHYKKRLDSGHYLANDIGMCLEIHTETATKQGTIQGLTELYQTIKSKMLENLSSNKDIYDGLSSAEKNLVSFDTIELMPEVPTSEREVNIGKSEFFDIQSKQDGFADVVVKKPDISNWGYDTPLLGSIAVSPSLLQTLRPDEMIEFIETIHTMPHRPIQLCIDSVLGHCDFQGAFLLETYDQEPSKTRDPKTIHSRYLTGPNMYGRDINFSNENVRAMLLEMLRRKIDLGYDCIRIDGAQDFIKSRDAITGFRIQDDDFLRELVSVEQNIQGLKRYLDINLEDGRPWPDDLNWLYNSTYLDHSIQMNHPNKEIPKQWSPVIFAHNVHGKYKWFMEKWDRFVEVYRYGEHWITGQSNHDNARYFYKMVPSTSSRLYKENTPFADYYNAELGKTKKEVVHNAMDHHALSALMTAFLPGHPMFLLNALSHTPWMFLRDIDHTYAMMILADEGAKFFEWYVDEETFNRNDNFKRVKALGFTRYESLMHSDDHPSFLNRLKQLSSYVKTDALCIRSLFENTAQQGRYENKDELELHLNNLLVPNNKAFKSLRDKLDQIIDDNQQDLHSFLDYANALLIKNHRTIEKKMNTLKTMQAPSNKHQEMELIQRRQKYQNEREKIEFLLQIDSSHLALLLIEEQQRDAYDVSQWAKDDLLNQLAPNRLKTNNLLDEAYLIDFSKAFFKDALEACKVHKYEASLNQETVDFNLACRRYRHDNPWLYDNPNNNIRENYFARKLYVNGAKDSGDWGDRGDIIHCNTLYYGWRTDPQKEKQLFILANMEGEIIDELPLHLFMNTKDPWRVILKSPKVSLKIDTVSAKDSIKSFKNGDVIVLERSL